MTVVAQNFYLFFIIFLSNFLILAIEITAGRSLALTVGTSLYTWTSAIGGVLAIMAVGHFIGGKLAQSGISQKMLLRFLLGAAFLLYAILFLKEYFAAKEILDDFELKTNLALRMLLVYGPPIFPLSLSVPIATRLLIEGKNEQGFMSGLVFATISTGSILGAFLSGFILIPFLGTRETFFILGLILSGSVVLRERRPPIVLFTILIATFTGLLAFSPHTWISEKGRSLYFRPPFDPRLIYEDESFYSHIRILKSQVNTNILVFVEDHLHHSFLDKRTPLKLLYDYEEIFASVLHSLKGSDEKLKTLLIGGGGYIVPRYIQAKWPGSLIEVVEIDPAVTHAAINIFDFEPHEKIRIVHDGGRRFINRRSAAKTKRLYDFIFIDAFQNFLVPPQLTTYELFQKCRSLLKPLKGILFMNIVDNSFQGPFLTRLVKTLESSFQHVYVARAPTIGKIASARSTFVLLASPTPIHLDRIKKKLLIGEMEIIKSDDEKLLSIKAETEILRDNFAPIENLLAEVIRHAFIENRLEMYLAKGERFVKSQNYKQAISIYEKAMRLDPESALTLNNLGNAYGRLGKNDVALDYFLRAVKIAPDQSDPHNSLGSLYYILKKYSLAEKHLKEAIRLKPDYADAYANIGHLYYSKRNFKAAIEAFETALKYDPSHEIARRNLAAVKNSLEQI